MSIPKPLAGVRYINADGTLTTEGIALLLAFFAALVDHETRIATLEP